MAAIRKNKAVELFWKVHRFLYRVSGGRIGGRVIGMPVLMLTTKGRKSGEPRSNVLTYVPKGNAFVVYASYAGEPKHPAWWLNLQARPEAIVEIGPDTVPIVAHAADTAERQRLWPLLTAANPFYTRYEELTARAIPVVILRPRPHT